MGYVMMNWSSLLIKQGKKKKRREMLNKVDKEMNQSNNVLPAAATERIEEEVQSECVWADN